MLAQRTPPSGRGERGQVLIMMLLAMTLIFLIGVLVVDFGLLFNGRESVVNAVDAATMSASLKLPKDGAGAQAAAIQYVQENDPEIATADIATSFRCIVGDRNADGLPDRGDVPAVCPQIPEANFVCVNALCYANCSFTTPTSKCNTIVVQGSKDVEFGFAPIFGIGGGKAAGFISAACRGACGGPPILPLDVVMVIDRTRSMTSSDLANAKNAAKSVLTLFNPEVQHVSLGTLPQSLLNNDCRSTANNSATGNWILTPLANNYQNPDGTLNTSSEIVTDINCLEIAQSFPNPGLQTDLGDPMKAAKDFLVANGRPGVKKGIIFLTDGEANVPSPPSTDTGYLNCGANAPVTNNAGDNNGYEITPSGACADGGATAVDADSGTGTSTSCTNSGKDKHIFRDYGITVPAGEVLTGIEVRLDAWAGSTTGSPQMCVELSWDGGANWTNPQTTQNDSNPSQDLTTSEVSYIFPGDTNWGHTFTTAQLSNATFRVRVTDVSSSSGGSTSTGTIQTVANGTYTAWTPGDETDIDETGTPNCSSGDSVLSTGTGSRESFTVSLAGVPNGATITSVDIDTRDRGNTSSGGTYQTFAILDGSNTDSGVNLTATNSGSSSNCSSTKTQTVNVPDTVKTGATTLEIGVVKTAGNNNAVRVGTISAIVHYQTVGQTFNLDWAAVRVYHSPPTQPCNYANQQADATKIALDPPIEVFTIGFGIEGAYCQQDATSSPYHDTGSNCTSSLNHSCNSLATKLLADMATDSFDDGGDGPGLLGPGCDNPSKVDSENADGDHFLCAPKTTDLEAIFRQVGEALSTGSRLVKLPF